jgi:two-component system, LytTR family, sensor histidine kinase AgrC
MAISLLFITIFISLCFKSNFLKISIDLTIIIFIGILSESLSQILVGSNKSTYTQLILFILIYLALFSLLNFILQKSKTYFSIITFPLIAKIIFVLLFGITVVVLYLNIFIPSTYEEMQLTQINLIIQLVYLVLISILFMLQIKIIKKENVLKYEQLQQSQYNQYLISLEAVNQDMQKFQHDYLNILMTMDGYISQGDIEGLKSYFTQKILKVEHDTLLKNHFMRNLGNLAIIELKGLLLTKLLLIIEKNIKFHIEIPQKISTLPIDIIDFSRILGILIDNAIEANEISENGVINVAILKTSNESILFIIENSFKDTLEINQIFNKNYSTKKGDNRGNGLANVTEILNNYPNVLLNTRIENHLFIQELELNHRK